MPHRQSWSCENFSYSAGKTRPQKCFLQFLSCHDFTLFNVAFSSKLIGIRRTNVSSLVSDHFLLIIKKKQSEHSSNRYRHICSLGKICLVNKLCCPSMLDEWFLISQEPYCCWTILLLNHIVPKAHNTVVSTLKYIRMSWKNSTEL